MARHRRDPDAYLVQTRHESGRHYRRWYAQRVDTLVAGAAVLVVIGIYAGVSSGDDARAPDPIVLMPVYPSSIGSRSIEVRGPALDAFARARAPRSTEVLRMRVARTVPIRPDAPSAVPEVASRVVRHDPEPVARITPLTTVPVQPTRTYAHASYTRPAEPVPEPTVIEPSSGSSSPSTSPTETPEPSPTPTESAELEPTPTSVDTIVPTPTPTGEDQDG